MRFNNQHTPRNLQDLNFTPSLIYPDCLNMTLRDQCLGFYTPNFSGTGSIFHNQAGDLHTSTLGLDKFMSLSPEIQSADVQPNVQGITGQSRQHLTVQQSPDMKMYARAQQPPFAPSAFTHRSDSDYDAMDESTVGGEMRMDSASNMTTASDLTDQMDISCVDPSGKKSS